MRYVMIQDCNTKSWEMLKRSTVLAAERESSLMVVFNRTVRSRQANKAGCRQVLQYPAGKPVQNPVHAVHPNLYPPLEYL